MPVDELAKKRWEAVPAHIRKLLEENVFCSNCGVTTIINYQVHSQDFNIVLEGTCKSCGKKVARVID